VNIIQSFMPLTTQSTKAELFRSLHRGPKILVLPNAWDVARARIFEEAGVSAIATTSAGVAFTLGYPDGQKIPREEMLAVVARIAARVKLPVTADVESGYGKRPEDAAQTAVEAIQAGAVGVNLEDADHENERALVELPLQLEKIHAVTEAGSRLGVALVINARTDVYLEQIGTPETRYDETIRRLSAYRDARADCLFAPGIRDVETIARLVRDLRHPLNILVGPGSPPIPELQKLGVARASLGSSAMRATLGFAKKIAGEVLSSGTYSTLEDAPPHLDVNRMMSA
jgi:2-methylisocitrate lyase-like PEP mutase family enzyme